MISYDFSKYYVHDNDLSLWVFGKYESVKKNQTPIAYISSTLLLVIHETYLPGDIVNQPDLFSKVKMFNSLQEAVNYIKSREFENW